MTEYNHHHTFSEEVLREFSQIIPKTSFDGSAVPNEFSYSPLVGDGMTAPFISTHSDSMYDDVKRIDSIEKNGANSHEYVENSPYLTIFLLINTMIGSGILNQPYVFFQSGLVGGAIGYIFASVMTWLGLNILTAAGLKAQIYEYGTLTKFALGRKGEIGIDLCIIVNCIGALMGYIVVVGSTISDLLYSWGCHSEVCGVYFTTIICVAAFVLPVCLLRHFGHLALLSLFSVFAILCVLFLVIIGGPLMESRGSVRVFNAIGTINSLGSIIFSLSCASANFQAYITTEKASRNKSSWMTITAAVVLIGSAMCLVMGVAGYLSFKSGTLGIILDNFNGPQFDFFKIMVAAHLILYIPVNFIIMRYSIIKLAYNMKSEDLAYPKHAVLTIGMLAAITGIVLLLNFAGLTSGDAFTLILNLTGGICGSFTSFILPSMVYLAICSSEDKLYWWSILNLVLGVAVMICVVVTTVLQYV